MQRHFNIFTIARCNQLFFLTLKLFISTADLFIIYGLLFCLDSLSPMVLPMIFYRADVSHLRRLHLQLLIFSYSDVMKTLGFGKKLQKFSFIYLYSHLLHSIVDIMGKSLLYCISLLHIQEVTIWCKEIWSCSNQTKFWVVSVVD